MSFNRPDGWTPHNLFGHAIAELLWLAGLDGWSRWVHEVTAPKDSDGPNRD